MISLLFFGLVASAVAEPFLPLLLPPPPPPPPPPLFVPRYIPQQQYIPPPQPPVQNCNGNFQLIQAINQLMADMNWKMKNVEDKFTEIIKRFPVISDFQEGNEDNKYKITIPLTGFEEKDIVVKVLNGQLMIQAIRETPGDTRKTYSEVRNLPNTVALNGNWVYDKSTLKITFPLKEGGTADHSVIVVPTECSTAAPALDREDNNNDNGDKRDAGLLDPRFLNEAAIVVPNLNSGAITMQPST